MRRILRFLIETIGFLAALQALAQTPQQIPITGNLNSILSGPVPYAGVTIQLQNCASPVTITGYNVIVQQTVQLQANAQGLVNSIIWPNDLINCNGTPAASQYRVQYVVGGVPSGTTTCYYAISTQSVWNLNTQPAVTCGGAPPSPSTGNFGNLNSTGFFQGNNGDFSGTLGVASLSVGPGLPVSPLICTDVAGLGTWASVGQCNLWTDSAQDSTTATTYRAGMMNSYSSLNGGVYNYVGAVAWSSATTYTAGYTVSYGGNLWTAVSPVTGTAPASPAWNNIGTNGTKSNRTGRSDTYSSYTPAQNWLHRIIQECYSIGECIEHGGVQEFYGDLAGGGNIPNTMLYLQQQQGSANDTAGGVYAGTVTAANQSTGVVTLIPSANAGTLAAGRAIRSVTSGVSGTFSGISCSTTGTPSYSHCTLTDSSSSFASLRGYVAGEFDTIYNCPANQSDAAGTPWCAQPPVTNSSVVCVRTYSGSVHDACGYVWQLGATSTTLTFNLFGYGTQQNQSWPAGWPQSGTYTVYRSAYPTAVATVLLGNVPTVEGTGLTACGLSNTSSTCVTGLTASNIEVGDSVDQVAGYAGSGVAITIDQYQHSAIPNYGGGIDIANPGASGSPYFGFSMACSGGYNACIEAGFHGVASGFPNYGIYALQHFATSMLADKAPGGTTPYGLIQGEDSANVTWPILTMNPNEGSNGSSASVQILNTTIGVNGNISTPGTLATGYGGLGLVFNAAIDSNLQNSTTYWSLIHTAGISNPTVTYNQAADCFGNQTMAKMIMPTMTLPGNSAGVAESPASPYYAVTNSPNFIGACLAGGAGGEVVELSISNTANAACYGAAVITLTTTPTFYGGSCTPTTSVGANTILSVRGLTSNSTVYVGQISYQPGIPSAAPFVMTGTSVYGSASTYGSVVLGIPAPAGENVVAYASSMTFSSTAQLNITTLTGNVASSTLAVGNPGQLMRFVVCQDSTGSRTFTWPTNVHGGMTIGSTASKCNAQDFVYSANQSLWFATSAGVTNE